MANLRARYGLRFEEKSPPRARRPGARARRTHQGRTSTHPEMPAFRFSPEFTLRAGVRLHAVDSISDHHGTFPESVAIVMARLPDRSRDPLSGSVFLGTDDLAEATGREGLQDTVPCARPMPENSARRIP